MDLNVINQLGRSTFLPQENIQYLNPYRYQSTNPVPSFAFGAQPMTSSFISLPKNDELEIHKKMQVADQPYITVVDQTFKTDEKLNANDLKVGAGMNADIEEAFSKPIYKVKEISVNHTSTSKKRQINDGLLLSGGSVQKTKKFKGRGLKFV